MKWTNKKNAPNFILLDDDPWALEFSKQIIRNYCRRAEIITFTAVEEAIAYFGTEDFISNRKDTIFLSDLHMPEIDGFALLDRMESRFNPMQKWLHIFVLSAAACPEEILRVSSYRCVVGFLHKPFSREKLEQIIDCIEYPL